MNKQNKIKSFICDCMRKLIDIIEDYTACIIGVFAFFGIGCALSTNAPYNYFPYDMNGVFDTCLYSSEIYIGSLILKCIFQNIFHEWENYYEKIISSVLWRLLCFIIKISKLIFTLTLSIFVFIGFQFINMGLDKNLTFEYALQYAVKFLIIVEIVKYFWYVLRRINGINGYSNKGTICLSKGVPLTGKIVDLKQNEESTMKNDEKS